MREPPRRSSATERGSVLVLVLLLMLALELLAHGALLMARQEEAASRSGARLLQARLAAERGLRPDGVPQPATLRTLRLGGVAELASGTLGAGRWRSRLERLGREAWLLESEGSVRGAGWTTREAVLAWLPDPVERLAAFGGVVSVGIGAPVSIVGSVTTDGVRREDDGDAEACAPWWNDLDSLFAAAPPEELAVFEPSAGGEPSLGPLGPDDLSAWMGAAESPGGRIEPGDLTLTREDGEGLLVVAGDLELEGGRWGGVVLVGGALRLLDDAELVGFARAAGGLEVARDARVVGSGCRALRALSDGIEGWIRPFTRRNRAFPLP